MSQYISPLTWLLGIAFTVAGVVGFIMGGNTLLWFQIDVVQNTIHVITGLAGLYAASRGTVTSDHYLETFGVVFLVIAGIGFYRGGDIMGVFQTNMADNYLYAGVGLVSSAVGFLSASATARQP